MIISVSTYIIGSRRGRKAQFFSPFYERKALVTLSVASVIDRPVRMSLADQGYHEIHKRSHSRSATAAARWTWK